MSGGERQLEEWRGPFGEDYTARNPVTEESLRQRTRALACILDRLPGAELGSILEVGANIGLNLRALARLTGAELYAVEPNARARKMLVKDGVVPAERALEGTAGDLPFADGGFDLVFTAGVLIHIPEAALEAAYREIHRVSRRYILTMEYFSPKAVTVPYHGRDEMLFKRDFGGLWLELFPGLEPVGDGFFWKRTTGLDDVTWWLFRKP